MHNASSNPGNVNVALNGFAIALRPILPFKSYACEVSGQSWSKFTKKIKKTIRLKYLHTASTESTTFKKNRYGHATNKISLSPYGQQNEKEAQRFADELFYIRKANLMRRQKEKALLQQLLNEKSLKYFEKLIFNYTSS